MNQHRDKVVVGDRVYFYQSGPKAGVYVVGRVMSEAHDEPGADDFGRYKVDTAYDSFVEPPLTRDEMLADPVLKDFNVLRGQQGTNFPLSEELANRLAALTTDRLVAAGSASGDKWDLRPGETIRRTELHLRYGGGGQGGISPSARTPNVLIFTDLSAGQQHGYVFDGWQDDETFLYTGEGQQGDQTLAGGNRAIAEHREQGRSLRVFDGVRGISLHRRIRSCGSVA